MRGCGGGHVYLTKEGIGGSQPLLEGDKTVELELPGLDVDLLYTERPVRQSPSGVHVGRPCCTVQSNGLATRVARLSLRGGGACHNATGGKRLGSGMEERETVSRGARRYSRTRARLSGYRLAVLEHAKTSINRKGEEWKKTEYD